MDRALSDIVCTEDFDIARTRYKETLFVLDCVDGTLCMSPGCGGLQGDNFMVNMWLSSFQPLVAEYGKPANQHLMIFLQCAEAVVPKEFCRMGV